MNLEGCLYYTSIILSLFFGRSHKPPSPFQIPRLYTNFWRERDSTTKRGKSDLPVSIKFAPARIIRSRILYVLSATAISLFLVFESLLQEVCRGIFVSYRIQFNFQLCEKFIRFIRSAILGFQCRVDDSFPLVVKIFPREIGSYAESGVWPGVFFPRFLTVRGNRK